MNRVCCLAVCLALCAFACGSADDPAEPGEGERPNVVLISLDTLRADHLSLYGYQRETAPALADLAAGGAVFENATSQAPSTVPTHASMFTGRYPYQHRMFDYRNTLDPREVTLAELFRENGYRTFAIASSIRFPRSAGYAQGFDDYRSLHDMPKVARSARVTEIALEQAGAGGSEPFFAFLHYFDAHAPYAPPEPYRTLWHPGLPGMAAESSAELMERHRPPNPPIEPAVLDYLVALYDGSIRYQDESLARVFAGLREAPNGRPTLWVLTSDHGEEFMEHQGLMHAHSLFQELLWVPLVVVYPGRVPAGLRISEPIQTVDLFPTILELAGVTVPSGRTPTAGRSFASKLLGRGEPLQPFGERMRDVVFAEMWSRRGVTATLPSGRFKLTTGGRGGLFRLDSDPGELVDVRGRHPEVYEQLVQLTGFHLRELQRAEVQDRTRTRRPAKSVDDESGAAEVDEADVIERLRALGYAEEVEAAERGE